MLTRTTVAGKELRDRIVQNARRFFGADAVAMWRLESRERMWRIAATTGLSTDYSTFAIEAPVDGNVAAMLPGPLLIADAHAWPVVDARRKLYDSEGIASFLVLPLIIRGETAGTTTCYYRTPNDAGFDAYLKKPVDPAELAQSVQRLSARRSMAAEGRMRRCRTT